MKATRATNYFEIYQRRREELLGLAREQGGIVTVLEMDETQTEGTKPGDILSGLLSRLETDSLRVLVIGRFSAGKSTFLNALFGQVILPASPTPTTGVVCEIKFADEKGKRARLFPKSGMGKNGDSKPFDLDNISSLHDELKRYVKINHSSDATATSRYERLELYWPLALCRNGVDLIDTVGLDDPDAREAVTMEYAQSVDAILYCMKSQDTYAAKDKQVLGLLKNLGYESIFFIITYYDHIRASVQMGETTEEAFKSEQAKNLAPWSELKGNGIKYVDSKSALLGRTQGNRESIVRSGIEDIESSLEIFLTQEKGRAKLLTSLRSLRGVNRSVRTVIPPRIGMWQTPNAKLEQRYREAEPRLKTLEQTRSLIVESATLTIRDIARQARDCADEYFLKMREKVTQWAADYEIESEFGFPPKLEPVVKEVVDHLKARIEEDSAEWSRTVLLPIIQEKIQALAQSLEGRASEFFAKADQIRIDLAIGTDLSSEKLAESMKPSKVEQAIAVFSGLIGLDPIRAGAGMFFGFRAMLNTIIADIVVLVVVGLFGVALNPFVIAIAFLVGGGAAGVMNIFQLKTTIRTTVGQKLAEGLDTRRRELCDGVRDKVQDRLLFLRTDLDESLAGEIASVRGEVEKIIEEQRQGSANATRKIEELKALQQANLTIEDKLDALMYEAGIGTTA